MITLITGGVRSGKSGFALTLAPPDLEKYFIATAEPLDERMKQKIRNHREERKDLGFTTIEEPLDLANAFQEIIENSSENKAFILADCMTLWVNNLLYLKREDKEIQKYMGRLLEVIQGARQNIALVTNETGWGVMPENALARKFSDLLGDLNKRLAEISDVVYCMVSGVPVLIKGKNKN